MTGKMAIPGRFERSTYCLEGSCSIQLSYGTNASIIADFSKIVNKKESQMVDKPGSVLGNHSSVNVITDMLKQPT